MSHEPTVARLKTTPDTLGMIERGVAGYDCRDYRPSYLRLSDGASIKISVVGTDVAFKFECFSLALEVYAAPTEPSIPFGTLAGDTRVSVLVREEYVAPFTGDRSLLLGSDPWVQEATKPGHVPTSAIRSCLAAYGLMIEGAGNRLIVAADWAPFKIVMTTNEAEISDFLSESEAMPIPLYARQYGFA